MEKDGNYNGLYRAYRLYIGVILGLYSDDGRQNGNYYLGFRVQELLEVPSSRKIACEYNPNNQVKSCV